MNHVWTPYKLAKILSWVIAGILVLLPFHAIFTTWFGSSFGHFDLFKVWKEIILIAIIPFTGFLVWRSDKLKQWILGSWITRLIGFYILLHLIWGIWAYNNGNVNEEALVYALIINLRFLVFFVVCYVVAAHHSLLRKNWQAILLAPAAIVILFGLLQRFFLSYDFLRHFGYGPDTIPAYQTVDSDLDFRRIQSTLRGANLLGAYLVLVITALLGVFKKPGLTRTISLLAAFMVLFYSYSRSAWIGTVIAVGLLFWWSNDHKNKVRWAVIASFSLVVIASGILLLLRTHEDVQDTLLHTSSSPGSSVTSNEARATAIKNGAKDVLSRPLGEGPGTAGPASARNDQPARIAENYYLQIGQEVGVLGLATFVAINILVGRELWQRRKDVFAQVLLASLAGLTAVNMLSHAWTDDTVSYLWWGLAGIALAPILTSRQKAHGKNHKA